MASEKVFQTVPTQSLLLWTLSLGLSLFILYRIFSKFGLQGKIMEGKFRPERFIGRDIDVRGQNIELIPFGSGRRGCPGLSLGLGMVEFALAPILHCFDWSVEGDPAELNMSEEFGLTMPRMFELYALPASRLHGEHLTNNLQQAALCNLLNVPLMAQEPIA
eukprot:Gb_04399 [translate_table: standard]